MKSHNAKIFTSVIPSILALLPPPVPLASGQGDSAGAGGTLGA